jgi:hypothetical protein
MNAKFPVDLLVPEVPSRPTQKPTIGPYPKLPLRFVSNNIMSLFCYSTGIRKPGTNGKFYLLFITYIICSICSPRHSMHFLSRFTRFVRILLNILGSTVAHQSVILCLR